MPRRNNKLIHKPYIFHDNCQQKNRYNSEKQAKVAAEFHMLENMGLELSVYKCPSCGYWHLTKSSNTDRS